MIVEKFKIPRAGSYEVKKHRQLAAHDWPWTVWRNGCRIGRANSIDEARRLVFQHVVGELERQRRELEEALAEVSATEKRLGRGDPVYLGKFMED